MLEKTFTPQNQPLTPFNTFKSGKNKGVLMADTIQGMSQKNAKMWQIIALVSLSSLFINLFFVWYAINRPKTVPVIVTVNNEGEARYVGKIDSTYNSKNVIPEIAKIHQIKEFIEMANTIVIDKSAQRRYVKICQSLVQRGAVGQLNNFFVNNNPYTDFGSKIQTVTKIEEPLKQSENTYIVYYNVQTKSVSGNLLKDERYSMLVTLDEFSPDINNPLGIYLVNFDIKNVKKDIKSLTR